MLKIGNPDHQLLEIVQLIIWFSVEEPKLMLIQETIAYFHCKFKRCILALMAEKAFFPLKNSISNYKHFCIHS